MAKLATLFHSLEVSQRKENKTGPNGLPLVWVFQHFLEVFVFLLAEESQPRPHRVLWSHHETTTFKGNEQLRVFEGSPQMGLAQKWKNAAPPGLLAFPFKKAGKVWEVVWSFPLFALLLMTFLRIKGASAAPPTHHRFIFLLCEEDVLELARWGQNKTHYKLKPNIQQQPTSS